MEITNALKLDTITNASIHDFNKDKDDDTSKGGGTSGANANNLAATIMQQTGAGQSDDGNNPAMDLLIDYNEMAENDEFTQAYFRDDQIRQTISVLDSKKKPNALLTGDAGVGKTQIVEEIARRLVAKDPVARGILGDAHIYELPVSKIVSGSSFVGQLEEKLYQVLDFIKDPANNAVLFIDEIHQLIGAGGGDKQYEKIAQILKPAMSRKGMRMIGATTTQEANSIMDDPAFSRRWSDVQVPELSESQTAEIIMNVRDEYQNHHNVLIPEDIVTDLVSIGDEFKRYGSHRPDSSLTLLDKAMSDAKINRLELAQQVATNPALQHFINANPKPVISIKQLKASAQTLLTGDAGLVFEQNADQLKTTFDEKIIGQTAAKDAVLDAVSRLGLRLTKRKRPTSFLFAGPSGTGKSEVAKQVTEAVFNNKNRMIYINMSEFTNDSSLNRIIGSSRGYIGSDSKQELPFDTLENNPYQLVLLDEFEKAHTNVQRFFMQALDEGVVQTNQSKTIDFSRTIIIATTNAGAMDMAKVRVGFGGATEEKTMSANEVTQALSADFDVELLNRFEHVIPFTGISKADYTKILAVKYNAIIKEAADNRSDLDLAPEHIDVDTADQCDTLKMLADESYTVVANGRPAERTIRNHIEDKLLSNPNATQFNLL